MTLVSVHEERDLALSQAEAKLQQSQQQEQAETRLMPASLGFPLFLRRIWALFHMRIPYAKREGQD